MSDLLINIDVPDVEAAELFYTAAFGLRAGRCLGADAVELVGWPVTVYLLGKPEKALAPEMIRVGTIDIGRRSTRTLWSRTSSRRWRRP